jgi:hypothetical protein
VMSTTEVRPDMRRFRAFPIHDATPGSPRQWYVLDANTNSVAIIPPCDDQPGRAAYFATEADARAFEQRANAQEQQVRPWAVAPDGRPDTTGDPTT